MCSYFIVGNKNTFSLNTESLFFWTSSHFKGGVKFSKILRAAAHKGGGGSERFRIFCVGLSKKGHCFRVGLVLWRTLWILTPNMLQFSRKALFLSTYFTKKCNRPKCLLTSKITLALQKATNKQSQEKETLFSSRDIFVGFAVGKKIKLCFAIFRHVTRKKTKSITKEIAFE